MAYTPLKVFEHELDHMRGMMARMCGIVENQVSQLFCGL